MYLSSALFTGLVPWFIIHANASPLAEANLVERSLPASECAKVTKVISILKVHPEATSFCSSFLGIKTKTETTTTVKTSTVTSTTGTPSTTVVFLPGNPPSSKERREAEALDGAQFEKRENPTYLSGIASTAISSGCECLNLPTLTATTTKTSTKTATTKVPATVTKTVYPCATPVPNRIPTVPYGLASQPPSIAGTQNTRYYLDTPEGASVEACCNLCYFGIPNCLQAFYYSYQGCVVQQPTEVTSTGPGVSSVCPNGQIAGLIYNPDANADPRGTGDMAGPCGQTYNNL
ncbi:MAG: hypothetical protein Q9201_007515 [Fulgogasparrea decipioides]